MSFPEMHELLADEALAATGPALGLDLTDRDVLLRAAAHGVMTMVWRNTNLEDIHAHGELPALFTLQDLPRDGFGVWRLRYGMDSGADVLGEFPDDTDADAARTHAVVALRVKGFPLPDDIMMRANTATVQLLWQLLVAHLGDQDAGEDTSQDSDQRFDEFLTAMYALITDPRRRLEIGSTTVVVADLLGRRAPHPDLESGWMGYLAQADIKLGALRSMVATLGTLRVLFALVILGAMYGTGLYPLPAWYEGLSALAAVDPSRAPHWVQLRDRPWTVTAAQARAVKLDSTVRDAVTVAVAAAQRRLGHDPGQ